MLPASAFFIMVDDSNDELFLADAIFRQGGLGERFQSARDATSLLLKLRGLRRQGVEARSIVVLLDINMPKTNGFELIYALRNDIETHGVRIIMVSGSRRRTDHDDSSAIGADGFITKPFSLAKLGAALGTVALST